MNWFLKLFVGEPAATAARPPNNQSDLVTRAKAHRDIPFVADVLKHYRHSGSMSPRQAEALARIVAEREEEAQRPVVYLGPVGVDVVVEGEVATVQYRGKGKAREGRYVIFTERGTAVFDGPAVLVGRLGSVRFVAKVIAHRDGDTHVADPRDIKIISRPSEKR